jgi:membrane protein DedA with SNARE-associated domain
MNTSDYLLSLLSLYGVPALSVVLLVGCIGLPMPASLMLMAAGSFVEQGELSSWRVIGMAIGASIVGDNIGYAIGRWGGHRLIGRVSGWIGGESKLRQAENWTKRWGGTGVFLTRWLLTPLGPLVNLTSGIAEYPWPRFLLFDAAGEVLWVVLYVLLGKFFSNRVQATSEVLGDFTWVLVGLFIAVVLGWKLMKYLRAPPQRQGEE